MVCNDRNILLGSIQSDITSTIECKFGGVVYRWNKCDILELMRQSDKNNWDRYWVVDIKKIVGFSVYRMPINSSYIPMGGSNVGGSKDNMCRIIFDYLADEDGSIVGSTSMDVYDMVGRMRDIRVSGLLDGGDWSSISDCSVNPTEMVFVDGC